MAVGLAELLAAWCGIVGGALVSQCAVPLDDANAGQLAKYVTKMWELDDESARELFAAAEGKRLLNTFGDWRAAPRRGHLPPRAGLLLRGKRYDVGARRWWLGPLVADIERMHPRTYISFEASVACKLEGEPTAQRVGKGSWRPTIVVKRMTARAYLRQLADDQRRADQHSPAPPDTPTPGADMVAAASGSIGPWSMRARELQRVGRLQLERKLAPVGPVVDVKPGDCGKRAWPPWAVEREQLGVAAESVDLVAGALRRLHSS